MDASNAGTPIGRRRGSSPVVVLTDEAGNAIGTAGVLEAHQHGGRLHRAFSIIIFNDGGEILLQRRSQAKRTFRGRWSNACCGHPNPEEPLLPAARRRLHEEMGLTVPLEEVATFTYRATDEQSSLTEHEFDHVLVGFFDGFPRPDPREADDWRWMSTEALCADLSRHPARYTPWLGAALEVLKRATGRTPAGPTGSWRRPPGAESSV